LNVLKQSQAPLKWSNPLFILIPKGDDGYYSFVTKLRPTILLKTIQKLFLKVLFTRITNKNNERSIQVGANTSVLLSASTYNSPIDLSGFQKEDKTHWCRLPLVP
jgi:hypothetical protein